MNVIEKISQEVERDIDYDDKDGPAIAHIGWREPYPHSFCGAEIIGVPAPPGYPHRCRRCVRLHRKWKQAKDRK